MFSVNIVFEENSGREIAWLPWRHRFPARSFVFKMFPVPTTRLSPPPGPGGVPPPRAAGFEECFRTAPFSWRISEDGRPNRRNKAAFSNSPDVVWMGPYLTWMYIEHDICINKNYPLSGGSSFANLSWHSLRIRIKKIWRHLSNFSAKKKS